MAHLRRNYRKNINVKTIIGFAFIVLGIFGSLYVGGWMMFIQPILEACRAFDAGELSATIVGITILKCIFANAVGWGIFLIGFAVGALFLEN